MDCNKEEAVRAKEIAEKKFMERDIEGAQKFALKAQSLYADLDGLSQLVATLDIYVAAEKRIVGEVDWYGVLGVDPSADDETIRKNYRRLALTLHPDKNKAVGADGAFKILSEAWSLLSERTKRIAYDQKRNLRGMHYRVPNGKLSVPSHQNGLHSFPGSQNFNTRNWMSPTHVSQASPSAHRSYNARDWRCSAHVSHTSTSPQQNVHPRDWRGNHVCHATVSSHRNKRDWRSAGHVNQVSASPHSLKTTFWTKCDNCSMQFEYPIHYLNEQLLCPNSDCRRPFVAIETPPPPIDGNSSLKPQALSKSQRYPSGMRNVVPASAGEQASATPAESTPFSEINLSQKFTSLYGTLPKFASDQSAPVYDSQPSEAFDAAFWRLMRRREEAVAVLRGDASERIQMSKKLSDVSVSMSCSTTALETDWMRKRKQVEEDGMQNKVAQDVNRVSLGNGKGMGMGSKYVSQKARVDRGKAGAGMTNRVNGSRELSQLEMRNILAQKAKQEIAKKLAELKAEKEAAGKREVREKHGGKQNGPVNAVTGAVRESSSVGAKDRAQSEKSSIVNDIIESESDKFVPKEMLVTDPDFYDFDKDRTGDSFADNQVWAAYDDDDGMPRFYALIHEVISLKPFKMRISWLTSKSNLELSPINWVGSGFAKTCGYFRVGKSVVDDSLNAFSHRMKWAKGARGVIQIYPSKGDVWALYRNWSPDWNENITDEVKHSYDMAEVIDEYTDELGVIVAPLVKVCGFKTVFKRHPDPGKIWTIPREELFRFSHQVPAHLLTCQDGESAPEGCWELDPASTPQELLQVVAEIQGREMEGIDRKTKTENLFLAAEKFEDQEGTGMCKTTDVKGVDDKRHKMADVMMKGMNAKDETMLVYKRRRQRNQ